MVKNIQYIKLLEVLSRALRHPMLLDVTFEAAILYAVDFIGLMGLPDMYLDKEVIIEIENYRGKLPCDLISVNQVKDLHTGICLRSMTDTFYPKHYHHHEHSHLYHHHRHLEEGTFKTLNTIIFTSFPCGKVELNYKAIPVDEDGYPLLINTPAYLKALELYIKKEVFTYKFDEGKLDLRILQNTQSEYAFSAAQCASEFNIPSESEMESICRSWCTLMQRTTDFDNGWRTLGNREYIRNH